MPIVTGLNANVFRAVSGSLFSSPVNWSRGVVPTGSDVALIADNCMIDVSRTVGSLIVQSGFTASISGSITFRVNDTINVLGQISCSGAPTVFVASKKNSISNLSPGNSTFRFSSSLYDQTVPGVTYNNVIIDGSSVKRLSGNAVISGSLNMTNGNASTFRGGGIIDAYNYDLTVSGSTVVNLYGAMFRKSGPGRVTFIGNMSGVDGNGSSLDLVGNPIVEFRNGIVIQFYAGGSYFDSGQGQWIFTTNNQNIEPRYAVYNNRNTTLVSGSIDVTVLGGPARSPIILSGPTNGTDPNSRLINSGSIYLNYAPSPIPMPTGQFIYNATGSSRLGFIFGGDYAIPYPSYSILVIGGSGTKSLPAVSSSVSASSLLFVGANGSAGIFDMSASNFYCGDINLSTTSTVITPAPVTGPILRKTGRGTVFITGSIFMSNSTLDFSGGNPSVTFTGNLTNGANAITLFNSGTGSWYFPSPEQSVIMPYTNLYWNGPLLISGTLKFDNALVGFNNYISGSINGTNSSARLINSGTLYFTTANSLSSSFLTGSPDFSFPGNTVNIGGDYSATISTRLNTFHNLTISGTGTKTLGTSSYVSGTLGVSSNSILDASGSDITINGQTTVSVLGRFLKTGPGTVKFNGNVFTQTGDGGPLSQLDFSGGNPNVECRGGLSFQNPAIYSIKTGTGSWYFIGNQNVSFTGNYSGLFEAAFIVSGSSTVNLTGGIIYFNNTVNGTSGSSVLNNQTSMVFTTSQSADNVMRTGSFNYTSSGVLGYSFNGNYNLPYTVYNSLHIAGTGIKYLTGSTTLNGGFTIASGATLELGNYNFVVSGTIGGHVAPYNAGLLSKSGSGNVIFKQPVLLIGGGNPGIDFSLGNPTVELQNGIVVQNGTVGTIKTGTGSWYATTNNQGILDTGGGYYTQFDCPIIISGAISLDVRQGNFRSYGYIDGTEANSRFIMSGSGTTISYYNSRCPMLTGSIDFSSSLNTFTYASGSQDIRGGTYRNLTMLNGTKTLQGNVSVLGTLNTGSGATLATINLNGFTLTNP